MLSYWTGLSQSAWPTANYPHHVYCPNISLIIYLSKKTNTEKYIFKILRRRTLFSRYAPSHLNTQTFRYQNLCSSIYWAGQKFFCNSLQENSNKQKFFYHSLQEISKKYFGQARIYFCVGREERYNSYFGVFCFLNLAKVNCSIFVCITD